MSRWWRAYDEAVDDPKLILLTDKQHRTWFNLCCVSSQNGGHLPAIQMIAIKLRMPPDKARRALAELVALRLVDEVDGKLTMHNWSGRQFKSDVSTPRVKAFRERERNGEGNVSPAVSETPPDTETDSEAETERTRSLRSRDARATEADFDAEFNERFWPVYPHKVGKPEAAAAFRRARSGQAARGHPPRAAVPLDRIMSGLDRYLKSKPPDLHWLHPTTFLNDERYDDEPASPTAANGRAKPANDALLDAIVREFAPSSGSGQRAPVANGRDDDHGEGPAGASGKHIDLEGAAYRRTS